MDNQPAVVSQAVSRASPSRPTTPQRDMSPSLSPSAPSSDEPRISPNTERRNTDTSTRQRHDTHPTAYQASRTLARPDMQDNDAHVTLSVVDGDTGVEHVLRLFVETDDEDAGEMSDEDERESEMEEEIYIYGACRYAVAEEDDDDETDGEDGESAWEDSDDEVLTQL